MYNLRTWSIGPTLTVSPRALLRKVRKTEGVLVRNLASASRAGRGSTLGDRYGRILTPAELGKL